MRTEIKISGLQIKTDGRTVWINSNRGMCVGRFSAHADYEAQLQGTHCLDCCHGLPFDESWERFKTSMESHYLIAIGDEFKPRAPS